MAKRPYNVVQHSSIATQKSSACRDLGSSTELSTKVCNEAFSQALVASLNVAQHSSMQKEGPLLSMLCSTR